MHQRISPLSTQYRPEIDGLRALAVLPVILFHAGLPGFSGGYIGVDVFFVISGYLIASILAADLEAGRFSLWRFYERRARRILPALFLVCATCLPFAWLWLMPDALKNFAQSLAAVALGRGIGAGLVVEGRLHRGAGGAARVPLCPDRTAWTAEAARLMAGSERSDACA